MKIIFEKWWSNNTKCFSIISHRKSWKKNGIKPILDIYDNGGRKKHGDNCHDISIVIGYTIIEYTHSDHQNKQRKKK